MLALEPLRGLRVVASAGALDAAVWSGDAVTVVRFAPDEAFGIGSTAVDVDDPDAVVEAEAGFVGARLERFQVSVDLAAHTDWVLPDEPAILAQGKIAGVPVKLLTGEPALLITQAAYADELARRLDCIE
ncbi:MAG TPA: hypothetical protein VN773_03150 [Verrucomicrobiae bacterium]|nr:hypothetical protein [Verrucomicrobiae bacterium]